MDVLSRLAKLEQQVQKSPIPSKEEWLAEWETLSELDKSLYVAQAENIEILTGDRAYIKYMETIAGYLQEMGLVDPNAPKLLELAAEMDRERENV